MLRNLSIKVLSVLLSLFYLVAVCGFDIHSDSESGRTYVALLVSGISCETLHPDSPCHEHEHEEGECEDGEDCCHDSVEVLSLTGEMHDVLSFAAPVAQVPAPIVPVLDWNGETAGWEYGVPYPDPPRLSLQKNCVLRV